MKFWKVQNVFILVLIIASFFVKSLISQSQATTFSSQKLPRLSIELNNVTLDKITSGYKGTKYPGNSATFAVNGETFEFSNVEIRGRGNTTWGENPKKPFQIKFDEKVNLFGMGKAKTWVLLANYLDYSHLRNDTGLFIADMVGEDFVKTGEFVELFIDGDYVGLYYLTHKIEIDDESVKLKNPYGVLFELDNVNTSIDECFYTELNNCLTLKDAITENDDEIVQERNSTFLAEFNKIEYFAQRNDWQALQELIDMKSFAEYFLISEFSVNPDAYLTSHYFYKNGLDDKIHAGPAWDFDLALGAHRWELPSTANLVGREDALNLTSSAAKPSPIFYQMIEIPEFREMVKKLFQAKMSGKKEVLLQRIDEKAAEIREAAIRDNTKWARDDFDESVKKLRDWVSARFDYFEEVYGK